jgi:hypothetical protein
MHTYKEIADFCTAIYGGRRLLIVPYVYEAEFLDVAAGSTNTQNLVITANADFVLTDLRCNAYFNAASIPYSSEALIPYANVQITDSGTNENFVDTPVDIANYAAIASSDRALDYPRFIQGRTNLAVVLSSFALAGSVGRINLAFNGVLVRAFTG